jgi:hypothetical protein
MMLTASNDLDIGRSHGQIAGSKASVIRFFVAGTHRLACCKSDYVRVRRMAFKQRT